MNTKTTPLGGFLFAKIFFVIIEVYKSNVTCPSPPRADTARQGITLPYIKI